jgi:hypothetical protein
MTVVDSHLVFCEEYFGRLSVYDSEFDSSANGHRKFELTGMPPGCPGMDVYSMKRVMADLSSFK